MFSNVFFAKTKKVKKNESINKNAFPKNGNNMFKDFTPSQPTCYDVLVMFGSSPLHKESNTVHGQVTHFDPDEWELPLGLKNKRDNEIRGSRFAQVPPPGFPAVVKLRAGGDLTAEFSDAGKI